MNSTVQASTELEKCPMLILDTILLPSQLLPPKNEELSLVWSCQGFLKHAHGEQGLEILFWLSQAVPQDADSQHRPLPAAGGRGWNSWELCPERGSQSPWEVPTGQFQAVHGNKGSGG